MVEVKFFEKELRGVLTAIWLLLRIMSRPVLSCMTGKQIFQKVPIQATICIMRYV